MEKYICYTDGSCDNMGTNHPGGAAYIVLKDDKIIRQSSKGFLNTTNNKMELLAIISAINCLPSNCDVEVHTDSKYCIMVCSDRVKRYKLNFPLIEKYRLVSRKLHSIKFIWVKGHNGNKYNEICDRMAYAEYSKLK